MWQVDVILKRILLSVQVVMVSVHVCGVFGPLCDVTVPLNSNFWQVKGMLKCILGIPKRSQTLIVGAKVVTARELVDSFCTEHTCYVHLLVLPPKCRACRNTQHLKMCSSCKTVWYCSASCQQSDWKKHRPECSV